MKPYLLDTSTLIDFSMRWEPVYSTIIGWVARGDDVGVCPVNMAEFYSGLLPGHRPVWDRFFATLSFWAISPAAARQAGA